LPTVPLAASGDSCFDEVAPGSHLGSTFLHSLGAFMTNPLRTAGPLVLVAAASLAFLHCAASPGRGNPSGGGGDGPNTGTGGKGGADGKGGAGGSGFCSDCVDNCPEGSPTTIRGVVVAGTPAAFGPPDPVYNALVYLPSEEVEPFTPGVSCTNCGTPVSGKPIATVLTNAKGEFELVGVPEGTNVPLVMQIGRWRRQVIIPEVKACEVTETQTSLTRLPRNQQEGDIPKIAVATSPYDAEECILRKIGIDVAEFTAPTGPGRVHIYRGGGATLPGAPGMEELWADLDTLRQYDIVLFPCSSYPTGPDAPQAFQNIFDYANLGGRIFATDLSYPLLSQGPAPFPDTAAWVPWGGVPVDPLHGLVDQSFPKGAALAEWLFEIGASQQLGHIPLHQTFHVVDAVNPPTTRWLYSNSPATVQTLSFNTPVGVPVEEQCGRAVYSNFHIATTSGGSVFPQECTTGPMTPQERVLEFLLFDLASCVQDDTQPPDIPK
jgi:hypothetical protein